MARQQQTGWDILLHMVPTSVVDAMAKGDILQVVVFASFFGVALAAIGERGAPVVALLDSVAQVMFRFTGYVMRFAPIGVMAAIAATVGGKGLGILVTLGKLVLTMYAGLVLFVLLVIVGAASCAGCRSCRSSARFASRSSSPSRRPAAKPRCPSRSR